MPRTILMGDPAHFSVLGGANPHTRNVLGIRKRVDPARARRQWHALARKLIEHGVEVCVIDPDPRLTGLVYPANAGFLYPIDSQGDGRVRQTFYLANLIPTRAAERDVYRPFLESIGYPTHPIRARFEGEADFFPAGRFMIFTWGEIERQRFAPRIGIPPWRRIYGFRSERGTLGELQQIAGSRPILTLQLRLEAHYHGDTVLCAFGAEREFILGYLNGLMEESRRRLRSEFGENLIELGELDAAIYAANAFATDFDGRQFLFLPEGASGALLQQIRERGVEPVTVDASEFLAKGGGSIKCMILDLGPRQEQPEAGAEFRNERGYSRLFPG